MDRKGSPRKNVQLVGGKPLIAWSIEASNNCPLIDRTILTTDDDEIAAVAKEYGAEVPFMRPKELGADDASTESALKHAVDWLDENEDWHADIVVFLQPTDLFRKQQWMTDVVQALLDDPELQSCFVGWETYKNYWQVIDGKHTHLSWRGYGPRQTKSVVIREDTGVACASRADLIRAGERVAEPAKIITTDDFSVGIDVQYPYDLWLANEVIEKWDRRPNY